MLEVLGFLSSVVIIAAVAGWLVGEFKASVTIMGKTFSTPDEPK